jgi:hypothetical protein
VQRGFRVNTFPVYRKPITEAENEIVNCAITTGADYILRMDDDIWGYQQGFINKLLDADKEYISGTMFAAGFPYSRCAFKRKDPSHSLIDIYKGKLLELDEVEGTGVQPCDLTATPFTLIKTSIYEKILTPYYENVTGVGQDSVFCQKLLDAGIQPYCHLDVQLNHRHVTFWNRHYLFNADARMLLQAKAIDRTSPLFNLLAPDFGEDGQKDILQLKMIKMAVSGTNVEKADA